MKGICTHHCHHLRLCPPAEQPGPCLLQQPDCQRYREPPPDTAQRRAGNEILRQIFDVEDIAERVDLPALVEAVHARDEERIEAQLRELLPPARWVQAQGVGLGADWGGVKIAVVCAVTHPRLRAAAGLLIGSGGVRLTLGRIESLSRQQSPPPRRAPAGRRSSVQTELRSSAR